MTTERRGARATKSRGPTAATVREEMRLGVLEVSLKLGALVDRFTEHTAQDHDHFGEVMRKLDTLSDDVRKLESARALAAQVGAEAGARAGQDAAGKVKRWGVVIAAAIVGLAEAARALFN